MMLASASSWLIEVSSFFATADGTVDPTLLPPDQAASAAALMRLGLPRLPGRPAPEGPTYSVWHRQFFTGPVHKIFPLALLKSTCCASNWVVPYTVQSIEGEYGY